VQAGSGISFETHGKLAVFLKATSSLAEATISEVNK
jgi:hypothetical protein